ncbi:uroporphyrinogen-III C-methyltransferase [Aestuariibacter sp. A3R04]|uniref:uroporphyrinogen-III C-methyltransferase n=1 Tax=Aestuariibacter sp. A3R04 TaxID=2841571 RepID=UPI001C0A2B2A|nr:uroporphyrinogen-III C-methyltransferase [Aestuariibacter sp. A3R04]MBU3023713.1 uroporphyrinogen-III C-methyltransferase [Aestuariibacter sp. A3R04]
MADNENKQTDQELVAQGKPAADEPAASAFVSDKKQRGDKSAKPRSRGLLWFVVIITLLIATGTAAAGYWFVWKKGDTTAVVAAEQARQQAALASLAADNNALQQQLIALEASKQKLAETVSNLTSKAESMQLQTEQLLSQLNDMEGRRPSDWLIAEADYLVRMAGRKVWLEKDTDTAILLLQNADDRLKELSDPSVIPIRGLIAEDIQTLRQANSVDRVKLALTLSGMLNKADDLPLNTFVRPRDEAEKAALTNSVDDWQSNLAQVWRSIVNDFISVRRTDAPVEPMMTSQEEWLYKEQFKLQIMQAQSAVMDGKNALFSQSLNNAIALLNTRFDADSPKVQGTVSALETLLDTNVEEALPSSLEAMAPLQRLLEQRVNGAFGNGAEAL